MRRSVKEGLFAVWAVALAVLFQHQSLTLTDSAALLPRLLIACIILLSGLMALNAVREEQRKTDPGLLSAPINTLRLCAFTGLLAAYIFSVESVGYFIATPLYILASYSLLRAAPLWKSLCIAVLFSLFIYLLFIVFLHLPIPLGLLKNLLGG